MTVKKWLQSRSWIYSSLVLIIKNKKYNNKEKESKIGNFSIPPWFQKIKIKNNNNPNKKKKEIKKKRAQIILGERHGIIGVRGGTLEKGRRLKKRKKKNTKEKRGLTSGGMLFLFIEFLSTFIHFFFFA